MKDVCIVGRAHSTFGKLYAPDVEAVIGTVVVPAIADAGVEPGEIDGVFVRQFDSGF